MGADSRYDAFSRYGSGVTFVSVRDDDEDGFFVAASVLTASVSPFTLAVSVGERRDALTPMTDGATWSLSILGVQHVELVSRLTGRTSPGERREAVIAAGARRSTEGPLWLPDALASFWCRTVSATPVNDQVLVVGEVLRVGEIGDGAPLMRWGRRFGSVSALPGERAA
ncbi:flavin reductase [Gordonia humi]|uniref:Flavin reductase (DIM6/NTAB) family NADH-FMN oxidoreductase RutF n=2 Tax=Gordonia humi TaxID=686429 RepID=A0A840F852_9ACTN|nr:flavin reductase (DIM6/NTAB) family NADH-FMN oxidoreductase RutF [Gordonia humi]